MKNYPVRFTWGQSFFLAASLIAAGFLSFYLGARFGPEFFWNIRLDRLSQQSLLPDEISEAELEALLKSEGHASSSFHKILEKKNVEAAAIDMPTAVPEPSPVAHEEKIEPPKEKSAEDKKEPTPSENITSVINENKQEDEKKGKQDAEVAKKEVKKEVKKVDPALEKKNANTPAPKQEEPSKQVTAKMPSQEHPAEPVPQEVTAPAVESGPHYALQAGSFSSPDDARALEGKLRGAGFSVYIQESEIPGKGKWYRVRVGKYPNRDEAAHALDRLKSQNVSASVVEIN